MITDWLAGAQSVTKPDHHDDPGHGVHSRLAARMGSDRPYHFADPATCSGRNECQHDLVCHPCGSLPSDGLAFSPPVALSAYFLKGVAPDWDLKDIYYGMMQFMTVQIFGLVLVFMFPWLVLWLPGYLYGN
jgi:hypothetical protein